MRTAYTNSQPKGPEAAGRFKEKTAPCPRAPRRRSSGDDRPVKRANVGPESVRRLPPLRHLVEINRMIQQVVAEGAGERFDVRANVIDGPAPRRGEIEHALNFAKGGERVREEPE